MTYNASLLPKVGLIAGGEKLEVIRYGDYVFDKGRPSARSQEEFCIKANVQPLTGDDLLKLEEGERTKEHIHLWTKQKLKKKDIILRNGLQYEVQNIEDWSTYQMARAARVDVQPIS